MGNSGLSAICHPIDLTFRLGDVIYSLEFWFRPILNYSD